MLTLAIDIYAADAPRWYHDFSVLVGEAAWMKHAQNLLQHTRHSPFLREHYRNNHWLTFALLSAVRSRAATALCCLST